MRNLNYNNPPQESKKLTLPLSHEVLKTLLYFNIFDYPLTAKEIKRFCGSLTNMDEIDFALGFLEKAGYIKQKGVFYSITDKNLDSIIERRINGNSKAKEMLKKAKFYSKLISYFPFVKGVYLSGSLSKGFADEESDVDYFIITDPGRLWLCRMLLVVFKRIFLFNSHKYFCVNYFIDTQNLEIEERNIYTATELATLIIASNSALYRKLMQANPWVKDFFPNTLLESVSGDSIPPNKSRIQAFVEALFPGEFSNILDDYCFKLAMAKWSKKFRNLSVDEFELNLRSKKNVSKHHPRGFQIKVVHAYKESLKNFGQKFNIKLFSE